jgi:hypothetical protein
VPPCRAACPGNTLRKFDTSGFFRFSEKFNFWDYHLPAVLPDRAMSENQDMTALCPKCGEPLIYVTSVPYPKSPAMRRTTFVCYPCNRTWSYALAPVMAEAYAANAAADATV